MRDAINAVWSVIYELCMMLQGAAKGTRNLTDFYEETTGGFVEQERQLRAERLANNKPKPVE